MAGGTWLASARLGLYFAWGMHALYARGEDVLCVEDLALSAYRQRASEFRADRFDPRAWASLASESGAGYALLSARTSDGYTLYPSVHSAFCSSRDVVNEFLQAFRHQELLVGVAYALSETSCPAHGSDPDQDPQGYNQMVDRTHAQLQELLSTCGLLDLVRLERPAAFSPQLWRYDELIAMIQHLQPSATIIEALQGRHVPPANRTAEERLREAPEQLELALPAVQKHWGFHAGDQVHRSSREIVSLLAGCASRGERLLLGLGPRPDGAVPLRSAELLRDVGQWLGANGAAIYDVGPGIQTGANLGPTTLGDSTLYLIVLYWPGSSLHLAGVPARVLSVRFLADGWAIDWRQEGDHLWLRNLPTLPPDPRGTVIAIEIDQNPG